MRTKKFIPPGRRKDAARRVPLVDPRAPGLLRWLVMTISVPLPWIGVAFAFVGLSGVARGSGGGWMIALGAGLVVFDIVLDVWLHRDSVAHGAEPGLNSGGARLVGRVAVLDRAVVAGRGRLRLGDSLWAIEGPDMPAGTRVEVTGTRGAVLLVRRSILAEH